MKLYTTVEAVPSRLLGVIRLLAHFPHDLPRDEAIALLQPRSLAANAEKEPDMAPKVFQAALEVGAIELLRNERGEECLRLHTEIPGGPAVAAGADGTRRWLSRRILHDLSDGASKELSTVLGWILSVPHGSAPATLNDWKQRFKDDGYRTEDYALNSDARWSNVFEWARYFGLIWQTSQSKGTGVVPDPCRFLEVFLPDLLGSGESEVSSFLARLRDEFPLFAVRAASTSAVGPGLSLALRGLRERGRIALWHRDDADRTCLLSDGEKVGWIRRA